MPDNELPQSSIILYQTEDGRTRVQCRFDDGTIWLTQAQIAELFQTTPQNVTQHLKALFAEGELNEEATCKDYLQVRREGERDVSRSLPAASIDVVMGRVHEPAAPTRHFTRSATSFRSGLCGKIAERYYVPCRSPDG